MMAMRYRAIAAFFCLLLTSTAVLTLPSVVEANFRFAPPIITVISPAKGATYNSSNVFVAVAVTTQGSFPYSPTFAICLLDGGSPLNITFLDNMGRGTFLSVPQGNHSLTAEVHIMTFVNTELTYHVGSSFNVRLATPTPPPTISSAPTLTANLAESASSVYFGNPVNFTVNVEGGKAGYAYEWYVDGQFVAAAAIPYYSVGAISVGSHHVYAKVFDADGNSVSTLTVEFNVLPTPNLTQSPAPTIKLTLEPTLTPSPTAENNQAPDFTFPIVLAAVVAVAVTAATWGYLKRRRKA